MRKLIKICNYLTVAGKLKYIFELVVFRMMLTRVFCVDIQFLSIFINEKLRSNTKKNFHFNFSPMIILAKNLQILANIS